MKRKRLVTANAAQLFQATPLTFDNYDFKQYPTDVYTNYGNIAWVTPSEAQRIADVFGYQYILEGSQEGSYYINPKYLDAEVEALLWRSRGTTPIEGDDKATYASGSKPRTSIKKEEDEYVVRLYDENGKMISDYFTTDKEDAEATAEAMKKEYMGGKKAFNKRLVKSQALDVKVWDKESLNDVLEHISKAKDELLAVNDAAPAGETQNKIANATGFMVARLESLEDALKALFNEGKLE